MSGLIIPLVLLFMAVIIGVCGRNRRFGFWGHFFASLLLSPVIGILLLLASGGGNTRTTV